MARVRDHVRGVIEAIAPNDLAERFAALGVRVIKAEARFTGPDTVAAGEVVVQARRFVLATGSRPSAPPIPGLDQVSYLTNESVFDLSRRPERLLVIGGGPIGAELAQAHRRLGAEVAILEAARLLPRDDPEMAAVLERALLEDGIELHTGIRIERIEQRDDRVVVVLRSGDAPISVEGSHLLVAAGRRPVTDGLGLEAAGIAHDKGGITVDTGLRTTNRRVYAIGDCAGPGGGPYKFTHVANYHAGLVIRSALFRLPVKVDTSTIPRVDLHRPGDRLGRHDRGGGAREPDRVPHPALAGRRERSRPGGASHRRPCEGPRHEARQDPRLRHRGGAGRRPDRARGHLPWRSTSRSRTSPGSCSPIRRCPR